MNDKLAAMIGQTIPRYAENPYWEMRHGVVFDKQHRQPFDLSPIKPFLTAVLANFRLNYACFQSEAQILVLDQAQFSKLSPMAVPEIAHGDASGQFHLLVLPQVNTWGNTTISEAFWQKEIAAKGIIPYMRIHSHHQLHAYQSLTDWSSLNSGSLELVIGQIDQPKPEIAFWLDERGTAFKNLVFKSADLGQHITKIPAGKRHK